MMKPWLTDYRNGSTTITKAFLVQQAKPNAFTTNLGSEPVAATGSKGADLFTPSQVTADHLD